MSLIGQLKLQIKSFDYFVFGVKLLLIRDLPGIQIEVRGGGWKYRISIDSMDGKF